MVDTSTAPPALAREIADAFGAQGVAFADAPVARTRQAAIEGTLSIMVGGEAELVERLRPLLGHIARGRDPLRAGRQRPGCQDSEQHDPLPERPGTGGRARHRPPPGDRAENLCGGGGAQLGRQLRAAQPRPTAILAERYPEGAFPVTYAMKDLDYALALAAEAGIDAAGAALVKALFAEAIESGLGARYHPVIATLIDRRHESRPEKGIP